MKKVLLLVVLAVVLGFAYYTISPYWRNPSMDEASPVSPTEPGVIHEDPGVGNGQGMQGVLREADFIAKAHEVEGKAQLIKVGDDYTVRFEDFKSINGPDLKIYLATDASNDDFIDLGAIKATQGNVNYAVPAGTDTEKYDTVLVWCKAFGVLFSYAELN